MEGADDTELKVEGELKLEEDVDVVPTGGRASLKVEGAG